MFLKLGSIEKATPTSPSSESIPTLLAHRIHRTSIERLAIQTRFVRFQSAADILWTVNRDPFYVSQSEYIHWISKCTFLVESGRSMDILTWTLGCAVVEMDIFLSVEKK